MVRIIVGSKNPVKINCVKRVFSKYFSHLEVRGEKIDSKVSYQPKSEKETIQGAKNRAQCIFKEYSPDIAIGIEGGLEYIDGRLYTFAWVCIESRKRKIGLGRTASFSIPRKMERLIKDGKELGEADDIIFGMKNSKQKMGAIGLLSKEVLDRTKLYEQGVICALLPFINKELYNK